MLSRAAESLYWTARYVERAEAVSRVLDVNFHALLDSDVAVHGEAWQRLLYLGGSDAVFREHFDEYTANTVSEFLLCRPENANSVVACVARARENARGVRHQISTEMWEELNRLHLVVSSNRFTTATRARHELFVRVREGSHAFQGVTRATLSRGEAYEFLKLGGHLERADVIARILDVQYPSASMYVAESREATVGLTALLKSCGAFEAFRKAENPVLRAERVLEFLLLDEACPRSVLFCLNACLGSLNAIAGSSDRAERAIGRLASELSFLDTSSLSGEGARGLLHRVLSAIADASSEIENTYFTTRVIVAGAYAQQQQQQQQQ